MTETTPSGAADGARLARWTIEAMDGENADERPDASAERSRHRVRFAVDALRSAREVTPS